MDTENLSTMFLNDVTAIDLAYLTEDGRVLGRSVRPQIHVTGVIDPEEKVVIDFSTVKKFLKAEIDNKEYGYDHKLCVPTSALKYVSKDTEAGTVRISTPYCELSLPDNAVRVFDTARYIEFMDAELQHFLGLRLAGAYGEAFRNVDVTLNSDMQVVHHDVCSSTGLFSYVHGLKSSTSWGCQNIAHGHSSFFQFVGKGPRARTICEKQEYLVIAQIEYDLRDAVFVYRENVTGIGSDVTLSYTTDRGTFEAAFNMDANNVFVLDTETTIEFLVKFFADRYKEQILDMGYRYVVVSEGLSKGATVDLAPGMVS